MISKDLDGQLDNTGAGFTGPKLVLSQLLQTGTYRGLRLVLLLTRFVELLKL